MKLRAGLPLLLLACADPPPAPPPPPATLSLANLCEELARADCARLEACGKLPPPIDRPRCELFVREQSCRPRQAAMRLAAEAGQIDFFELTAETCRAAVAALPCEVGLYHDPFALPECAAVASGKAAAGGACHLELSCTNGHFCRAGQSCPGTCTRYLANNEPCAAGERCAPGLYCSVTAMRCREPVALGAPCELSLFGNSCRDGGFCDASQPGQATCAPVRGRQSGCMVEEECATQLRCVANRCSGGQLDDSCTGDQDCGDNLRCHQGECVVPLPLDAGCTSGRCGEGLACEEGFCRPQGGAGESCPAGGCWSGRCTAGTCAEAVPDGETCASAADCLPGRGCTGGRCAPDAEQCRP